MTITLDVESVRAFVAIADLKSFTQAANLLGTTQSTLSLRLRRLEERINRRLIERTPRIVRLSSHGESFIPYAREFLHIHEKAVDQLFTSRKRLKLGIGCHIIGSELKSILSKVNSLHPHLALEISTNTPSKLKENFQDGQLDAIIMRSEEDRKEGTLLCIEHYSWYASPNFEYRSNEPLKLATLEEKCEVRDRASLLLKQAGIPSINVLIGGNTEIVNAAIYAGMAVGVYTHRLAPEGLVDVRNKFNLPTLPTSSIELHTHLTDQETRSVLRDIGSIFEEYNPEKMAS